jgi:DNA-cytosine methyltransferase
MTLKVLDLFSGIGGFSYAAERLVGGFETTQFVEIDPYAQSVLRKNFPNVPIHDDIKTFKATKGQFDIITAGFPCQDLSVAGQQAGIGEGTRSGLFFEILRLARQIRPKFILFENVRNLISHSDGETFQQIIQEIAKAGFNAEWSIVSAKDVGACHKRERIWIIAYPSSVLQDRAEGTLQAGREATISSTSTDSKSIGSYGRKLKECKGERQEQLSIGGNNSREFTYSNSDGSSTSERLRVDGQTDNATQEGEEETSQPERGSKPRDSKAFQRATGTKSADSMCERPQGLWREHELRESSEEETPCWSPQPHTLDPDWRGYVAESTVCKSHDGLRNRVARLKALGNSIVPQCAAVPLARIKQLHTLLY